MQNQLASKLIRGILTITLALTVSFITACSFPGVYKINVQQGNIVTQEMLDELRTGMTKRQVHFVLGTPIAKNIFSHDYESYIYTYLPAEGEATKQVINVYYQNGQYTHHEGQPIEEHPAY